ncbi:predicted protein [Naegleria gruberi]|uniref:Predicted protein n=1 Tax=Naegleria gruberi TaxID=5762 RepID=D2VC30_NAEGR|nr:uncharacterized protein NAEGRDRAFT_79387 [Naegleria gruberi]EFC45675.1 predicted protein [Naegleria gruberi]|eukprot:XP_002678419.1 predicted protein [Naegleria gruberi strain NEG-M]
MQQPRRSLSASNITNSSNNNNNNTTNTNNGSSTTPVVESVHDKRINYHELMQMLGTENLQHASLMMGASHMHPNTVDPTTPLSANSHHHLASFVHPNATTQMSTTQLLLEELNNAVDHTHHQATLQMLASGQTNNVESNNTTTSTSGNSIVNNAALLSAAAGHHPYHYYPSQYSPYLYHPLSHPIHPIHFSSHTPLAALYDQSAAAAVLLQQQQQLLNHSHLQHSLPTASSTTTTTAQQLSLNNPATVITQSSTNSNNNTVSNVQTNTATTTSQNVQNTNANNTEDEEIEDDSDSKPMDCKKEGDNTSECEENREWSNCHVNRDFLDSSNVQVNIYLETRDSGPRNDSIVESELYSSIKYEMRHEIKCLKFLNESDNDLQLFCRVQIIHPDNKNEVLKNGKTILGGVVESNVSKGNANENIASTSMKIKFTDCSYHHGNCKFAFRVSYFIESDLDNPILIKESASFKVLARKPSKNKTKKQASKRKRKEEEAAEINTVTTTTTPQSSPQKVKISSFDDFKQVTTSVFDYIQTNTDEQKKRQMINYVITKLYSVDPNIMFSLPTDDGANDIFKGLL